MLRRIIGWIMVTGVLLAGLGLLMGQVAVGQRGLIGWLGAITLAVIAAMVIRQRIQRGDDPEPENDRARNRARRRSNAEVAFLVSCVVTIPAFLWTAGAEQQEFETATLDLFKVGAGGFLVALVAEALRSRFWPDSN